MSTDSGMAMGVFAAMICVALIPILFFAMIGHLLSRRSGRGAAGAWAGAFFGVMFAAGAVMLTFYEDTVWAPRVELLVPAGFAYDSVILLEDPRARATFALHGLPPKGRLRVPRSGVVRVRSLGELIGRGDARVTLSTGVRSVGMSSRPTAPRALGGRPILIYSFTAWSPGRRDVSSLEDDALVAEIVRREAPP